MTVPRRVTDLLTGCAWLVERGTEFVVGVAAEIGLGQGEYRRFRLTHLAPRTISSAYTLSPLDDGAHLIASAAPTITIPVGLHAAFRCEITGVCTIAAQNGLTAPQDQRITQAGLPAWAEIVPLVTDATNTATQFAIRGQKQS